MGHQRRRLDEEIDDNGRRSPVLVEGEPPQLPIWIRRHLDQPHLPGPIVDAFSIPFKRSIGTQMPERTNNSTQTDAEIAGPSGGSMLHLYNTVHQDTTSGVLAVKQKNAPEVEDQINQIDIFDQQDECEGDSGAEHNDEKDINVDEREDNKNNDDSDEKEDDQKEDEDKDDDDKEEDKDGDDKEEDKEDNDYDDDGEGDEGCDNPKEDVDDDDQKKKTGDDEKEGDTKNDIEKKHPDDEDVKKSYDEESEENENNKDLNQENESSGDIIDDIQQKGHEKIDGKKKDGSEDKLETKQNETSEKEGTYKKKEDFEDHEDIYEPNQKRFKMEHLE